MVIGHLDKQSALTIIAFVILLPLSPFRFTWYHYLLVQMPGM